MPRQAGWGSSGSGSSRDGERVRLKRRTRAQQQRFDDALDRSRARAQALHERQIMRRIDAFEERGIVRFAYERDHDGAIVPVVQAGLRLVDDARRAHTSVDARLDWVLWFVESEPLPN